MIVLAGLVFAGGCRRGENKAANAPPPAITLGPEDTALVTRAPIQSGPAITGTLAAENEATIRSLLSGAVL
ncbi:MAG TPA: efflux RND transporter periplasmic adaptor subunit, partial [Thermoanaerobaculia bacterium]|nr:efflux RND transporter periplasmic adaptor subunit [Thermoanaerobaculia bacterium]